MRTCHFVHYSLQTMKANMKKGYFEWFQMVPFKTVSNCFRDKQFWKKKCGHAFNIYNALFSEYFTEQI